MTDEKKIKYLIHIIVNGLKCPTDLKWLTCHSDKTKNQCKKCWNKWLNNEVEK